eukprot:750075_1
MDDTIIDNEYIIQDINAIMNVANQQASTKHHRFIECVNDSELVCFTLLFVVKIWCLHLIMPYSTLYGKCEWPSDKMQWEYPLCVGGVTYWIVDHS